MVVFEVYYGHSFFYCFHFMSFVKDMFREFGFAFCISEVFPMFFKSCVSDMQKANPNSQHVLNEGHDVDVDGYR